jgi:two-component system sensor histidine kinase/response regulator
VSVISVEDHPQGAKEIVNSLRSMGATVESCPTYKEGLALIKRRPFDVAVIDQGLPDGLGLDLIKEATKIRPNMGLVMYTVRDDVGLSHSLTALGVNYLTKPASRVGLGEAVRDATNKMEYMEISGPTKMLIAEDTPSVQDILQRQLDKLGVEASFVENGKQALKALNTGEYGILITDLHMPELDGYGLVNTIRSKEQLDGKTHFPVIVLTADVQMSERETYLKHGFDECLLKPVSLGQFRRLLIRWGLLKEEAVEEPEVKPSETPSDKPAQSSIDHDAVVAQMGAFDDMAIEMLGMFVDMTQSIIDQLVPALAMQDYAQLAELGHSLKGGARSACCTKLGDLASDLQDEAEAKRHVDEIVEGIIEEFKNVESEIKALAEG